MQMNGCLLDVPIMSLPVPQSYSLPTPTFRPSVMSSPPTTPTPRHRRTTLDVGQAIEKPHPESIESTSKSPFSKRSPGSPLIGRLPGLLRSPTRARDKQLTRESQGESFLLDDNGVISIPVSSSSTHESHVERHKRISIAARRVLSSPNLKVKKHLEHRLRQIRHSLQPQKSHESSNLDRVS